MYEDFINEYKQYFMSNEEIWTDNLCKVKEYINTYNKLPSKQLYNWLQTQKSNYKNNISIMKNNDIKTLYEDFINEYKQYFMSDEELWTDNLCKVKEYMNTHNKLPSKQYKQLYNWLYAQKSNYKNNTSIMKNNDIKTQYEEFINEYNNYF